MLGTADARAPARLGPYRILGPIGEGGMGVVYGGEHVDSGERVALKTVRLPHEGHLSGIRREVRALLQLHHPGVVRVLAEGVEGGLPWYAMELLEGRTLREKLRALWAAAAWNAFSDAPTVLPRSTTPRGATTVQADAGGPEYDATQIALSAPVTLRDGFAAAGPPSAAPYSARPGVLPLAAGGELPGILTIFCALCDTLAFLHGDGMVHRDLKPENIFLRADGTPVLVDFGLAWRVPGAVGREVLDVSTSVMGTLSYMAPEQIRAELPDARADLYAVGCMLYEAVTGKVPFDGPSPEAVIRQHVSIPPVPPSMLVSGVPPALSALILHLLEKRPRDRLGHAADVAHALAALGASRRGEGAASAPRAYVYRPELVGREDAFNPIARKLDQVRTRSGGLVLVRGESGIGKTSLAMAVARTAAARGFEVVTASCVPVAAAAASDLAPGSALSPFAAQSPNDSPLHPFRPFLQVVADRCLSRGAALTSALLGDRAKLLAACEPSLAALPWVEGTADPAKLSGSAARERLLRALGETIRALSRERPLLLLLDDLQWADELSREFLASLSEADFAGEALLLLGTYRAEQTNATLEKLAARPWVSRIDLGRLDERSIAAMIGDMLGMSAPPAAFVRSLAERAEGNPFFVAEYLRTAAAEGLLQRSAAGGFRVVEGALGGAADEQLPLPRSLHELVAHHLSGLAGAASDVVLTASVIGREFDADLLASVTDLSGDATMEAMRELLTRQLLEEKEAGGVRFVHDKLREIAYERLPAARRAALHGRVGRALEARFAPLPGFALVYPQLAHHFTRAGDTAKAIEYLEHAGSEALKNFANREAVGFFRELIRQGEKALAARADASRAPDARDVDRLQLARWERHLAEAYLALGDMDATVVHATRALTWTGHAPPQGESGWMLHLLRNIPVQAARRLTPAVFHDRRDETGRALLREAALASIRLSDCFYFSAENLPFIAVSLGGINLAEAAGGSAEVAQAYAAVGMVFGMSKLPGLARRYFTLARAAAERERYDSGLVNSLCLEAACHLWDARWDAFATTCEQAVEIASRTGDRQKSELLGTLVWMAHLYRGRFHACREGGRHVAHLARERGSPMHVAWGLLGEAAALVPLDALDEAERLLDEACGILASHPDRGTLVACTGWLALIHLYRGDLGRAEATASLTLSRAERHLPKNSLTTAYTSAAEVYLALWDAAVQRGLRGMAHRGAQRGAARALSGLSACSFSFSPAKPSYHRLKGWERWLLGAKRDASRCRERALDTATALGMPYEEARVRLDLARAQPAASPARRAHLSRAEALFAEMQCPRELAAARALRG